MVSQDRGRSDEADEKTGTPDQAGEKSGIKISETIHSIGVIKSGNENSYFLLGNNEIESFRARQTCRNNLSRQTLESPVSWLYFYQTRVSP